MQKYFVFAGIYSDYFCMYFFILSFFALIANVQNVAKTAETTVGITVFLMRICRRIRFWLPAMSSRAGKRCGRRSIYPLPRHGRTFKTDYFEGMEELAEGFADDNPLSGSASYEIFLNNIEEQDKIVERLEGMEGVRKVRYSSTAVAGLTSAGKMVGAMSAVIICVLLAVAVFLISNTISVAAAFRRRENEIMRLIGATNYMIRAPFCGGGRAPWRFGSSGASGRHVCALPEGGHLYQ